MAASRAAATSLASRAVHIRIHPRPRNLNESRQILRVLEQFGEVVMYKNLRYEQQVSAPNSALAIYQHAGSASNLLNKAPIRFALQEANDPAPTTPQPQSDAPAVEKDEVDAALEEDRRPGKSGADEMLSAHTSPIPQRSPTSSTAAANTAPTKDAASMHPAPHNPDPPPANAPRMREFEVTAEMSTFHHQGHIERQAHYGGFNVEMKTLVAEDLAASVPLLGMADVLTREVEVPLRIQKRRAEELARVKSLREMWEEGMSGLEDSREAQ